MSIRKSSLDFSLFNFAVGNATITHADNQLLDLMRTVNWDVDVETEDGSAINSRYGLHDPLVRSASFDAELMVGSSGARKVGLDVTVWSIGGSDQIGRLESGSLRVRNQLGDAEGIADWDAYPQVMGTDIEFEGDMKVTATAAFWETLLTTAKADRANLNVVVSTTVAGVTLTAPMLMSGAGLSLARREFTMERVRFQPRMTSAGMTAPTDPTTRPYTLLQYLLYYPAASAGYALRMVPYGTTQVDAANVVLEETEIRFARRQLISQRVSGRLQGAGTIS